MVEMESGTSILVVDDDEVFRERLARALRERGFDVRSAPSTEAALPMAEQDSPELAVVDLRMGGASGLALVRGLLSIDPGTRIVVLTGYGSIATAVEAIKAGAVHYMSKPADVDEILAGFDGAPSSSDEASEGPTSVPSLARTEWEHINRVLSDCGGNISQAARLLGLHRRSLQRKLSKYPVSR